MYQDFLSVVSGISLASTMPGKKDSNEDDTEQNKVIPPAFPAVTERIVSDEENNVSQRRLARTREVKVLVSPIMQRMKASLAKIQDLEESLSRSSHLVSDEEHQSVGGGSSCSSTQVHRRSRRLLKNSMRMLKGKLTALPFVEEQ